MKNFFKNMTLPELKVKRTEMNRKYMELRFQMVIGHIENPLQKRVMRRQIAKLNTLIGAQEKTQAKGFLKQEVAAKSAKDSFVKD
ncbi:MAG: 50S ribosomal protein L29 [Treponema sp.]|jgi:large subunit ribosomal protein L29|nr:50S ribosomal protein L29 [Treponema sp.]